jgi:REP element-mobilizing transposase RayT
MVDPGTWFITKCLHPRRALLAGDAGKVIADALPFYASRGDVVLGAFCVMPDHWHALLSPVRPRALPAFMRSLDHWVTSQNGSVLAGGGCRWQDGYQDTRIRSTRQFHFVRNYIHGNPVEKGLVLCPEDWLWSTAHEAYARCATIPWPWRFEQDGLTDEGVPW